jgi:hypothetical protein
VAVAVLKSAPDEYDDAVVKGRIVRPIGYQTARGFMLQADRMIESVSAELERGNAMTLADIRAGLSQLKTNFASLAAPKEAVTADATFLNAVAKIERTATPLM